MKPMDKETAKTAIREELARRVRFSGGPEVIRRFLRAAPTVTDAALRELVAEGFLKETVLRVGRLYTYPANVKQSDLYLAELMANSSAAAPRARAAHTPAAAIPAAASPTPAAA